MQKFCAFLFFCLFFSASAFAQGSGTIQCDPGSTAPVPAYAAPGRPHVVQQLSCGQIVSVVGTGRFFAPSQYSERPSEYVKIQIGQNTAYVDAKNVKLSESKEPLSVKKVEDIAAEKQNTGEEEEGKKWNVIAKDSLKLRDEMLLNPIVTNGPRTFSALISNNSEFSVSHLRLFTRLYDCSGKPKRDYSNCEIIGEVDPVVVPASIPPGQTRRVTAPMQFVATPRAKGTLGWGYWIVGVRAE